MIIIQSACFVENGELNYIVSIATEDDATVEASFPDGTEKIVHNNVVYTASGGTGIPSITETSFYSMYKK